MTKLGNLSALFERIGLAFLLSIIECKHRLWQTQFWELHQQESGWMSNKVIDISKSLYF
jgi:hypothetical protein